MSFFQILLHMSEGKVIAPLMISTLNFTQLSTHNYTGGLLSFKELTYIYYGS